MQRIANSDDLVAVVDNTIIGAPAAFENSVITIEGTGNVVYFEEGVRLQSSTVRLAGSGGLVMFGKSKHPYLLDVTVYNNCTMVFGRDVYFNGVLHAIASEERTISIGDGCLVSFDVWIRTADPHLVYDVNTKKRLNASKDVYVGDHVWIGQDALILKGATIGSGSIIGAKSLVAGKTVPSNASFAGNPAKIVKERIFWEGSSVHAWTKKKSKKHETYEGDEFVFVQDESSLIARKKELSRAVCGEVKPSSPAVDRLERWLVVSYESRSKNRFAIDGPATRPAKSFFGRFRA